MRPQEVERLAARAIREWGGARHPLRLASARENAVFEAVLNDGRHVALRLHREGYQGMASIRSELTLLQLLDAQGLRCPAPVPTLSGALVATVGGRVATAVRWLYGQQIGTAGRPLEGTPEQQEGLFRGLGRTLARFHAATDTLSLPQDFVRPFWDEDGLLGDSPLWGRFWENPALGADERGLLLDARQSALDVLAGMRRDGADFGLIHADALRENVLLDGAGLTLIDYDDCGFGFRAHDLGVALSQNDVEPHADRLEAALLQGYREERELPEHAARLVPMFTMLRALASCGWIVGRADARDERLRHYAGRAVAWARAWLGRA